MTILMLLNSIEFDCCTVFVERLYNTVFCSPEVDKYIALCVINLSFHLSQNTTFCFQVVPIE